MFAILFAICAASTTALVAYAPESFLSLWLDITLFTTSALCHLLGIPVTTAGDIMTVNGFPMRIITQCTALHYVVIISTAILLYSKHSLQYRITGLIASTVLIIAANALRLVITGIAGSASRTLFLIIHDYLWLAAFSLLVLGIWIAWAEQKLSITKAAMKQSALAILSCTAVYGILCLMMPFYGRFMALIASPVFKMLISEPQSAITFTEERMFFSYPYGTFTANFSTDLLVVALYLGLVLSTGVFEKVIFKRMIKGLAIILCLSVAVIAGGGAVAVTSGKDSAVVFLWTAHGLLLQLTLLWWMLRRSPDF